MQACDLANMLFGRITGFFSFFIFYSLKNDHRSLQIFHVWQNKWLNLKQRYLHILNFLLLKYIKEGNGSKHNTWCHDGNEKRTKGKNWVIGKHDELKFLKLWLFLFIIYIRLLTFSSANINTFAFWTHFGQIQSLNYLYKF